MNGKLKFLCEALDEVVNGDAVQGLSDAVKVAKNALAKGFPANAANTPRLTFDLLDGFRLYQITGTDVNKYKSMITFSVDNTKDYRLVSRDDRDGFGSKTLIQDAEAVKLSEVQEMLSEWVNQQISGTANVGDNLEGGAEEDDGLEDFEDENQVELDDEATPDFEDFVDLDDDETPPDLEDFADLDDLADDN